MSADVRFASALQQGREQEAGRRAEQLVMVLPETGLEGAYDAAERVRGEVEQLVVRTPEGELRVTASFGVATQAGSSADDRELVEAADAALYEAKAAGRKRTVRGARVGLSEL